MKQINAKNFIKKYLSRVCAFAATVLFLPNPVQAYENCVIYADGKLTDISVEQNDVVDICPLFTVMNEKNTLLVRPLKEGTTRFCVLKDGKDKVMFNVRITGDSTVIDDVDGFEILTIDSPPDTEDEDLYPDLPLDEPPESVDEPPKLRGEN